MSESSKQINAFIHDLSSTELPDEVMHMARRCLVDLIAIWAAGAATRPSAIARNHAARRYAGTIPIPFDGRATNPVGFAFAGAATIDAVDGHDGHQLTKGHAGVAILPAVLAELGGQSQASMDELLTHLVIGYEVAIRSGLTQHATVPDYHSSGSWNSLGCTAVAARVRGFSPTLTREALGVAEYFGPRAQMMRCIDHPTMVKDSSSWGALVGISAADLAEDGFTGAPALTCESEAADEFWHDLGQRWRILETNFKAYPVCRWAQPAIEASLALVRAHAIEADDIAEITVSTFHEATRLATRRPADGDAAQYSLPLAVALALIHGTVLPEHVLPENFSTEPTWRLVDSVRFAEKDAYNNSFPEERMADVAIALKDGQRFQSEVMQARGNFDAPLPDSEILEKLTHYASSALSADAHRRIAAILDSPADSPNSDELFAMMQPGKSEGVLNESGTTTRPTAGTPALGPFNLERLVADLRVAALKDNAGEQIDALLRDAVQDPDRIAAGMPAFPEDDTILFEDDSISIWHCRFQPGFTVPAHDHQMRATVAVYDGAERNDFYARTAAGELALERSVEVKPGMVIQIEPDDVHAVGCASTKPCSGIHVYQGKLTTVERSLFDTNRNEAMPFSDENYARLTRED